MKKNLIAIITAIFMLSGSAFAAPSGVPYSKREFYLDTKAADMLISDFKTELEKPNNFDKVFKSYNSLLELYENALTVSSLALNEKNLGIYGMDINIDPHDADQCYMEAVHYINQVQNSIKHILSTDYADEFSTHWGEERTAMLGFVSDITETNAKEKAFYDRYYEILGNENPKKADECAKLLLEIVQYRNGLYKDSNYLDGIFNDANRGYSTESLNDFFTKVAEPFGFYVNKFKNYGQHLGLLTPYEAPLNGEPKRVLGMLFDKLSPKFKSGYDYLIENGLYFYKANSALSAGYTIPLPYYNDAGLLIAGGSPIKTFIHEFGHFYSILNEELTSEELFFAGESDMVEFDSQALELIATDSYDILYGENANKESFKTLINSLLTLTNSASAAAMEIALYISDFETADELNIAMTSVYGNEWYKNAQFFTHPGNMIRYALTLFDAVQVFDLYLRDSETGFNKYLEISAMSDYSGSYAQRTEQAGLVSAFDENAFEVLTECTDSIMKTLYGFDYLKALHYFENGVYMGKVHPSPQKVKVNDKESVTLYAYNLNDTNYIRIRDLAMLLNGTSKQFDVEYDDKSFTVNIISGKPYTPDGTEMQTIEEIETAGMKSSGTAALLLDGEPTNFAQAIFVNNQNSYLLRGLANSKIIDIEVDYDDSTNTVLISTN